MLIIKGLNDFIESKRKELNLDVKEMQSYLGVNKGTYYNIKNKNGVADAKDIIHFFKLFGLEFWNLLELDEKPSLDIPRTEKEILLKILVVETKQLELLKKMTNGTKKLD